MEVRNKCGVGDRVEILSPRQAVRNTRIEALQDDQGNSIQIARPGTRVYPDLGCQTRPYDLVRKIIDHQQSWGSEEGPSKGPAGGR
jgi:hypothetical protein